MSCSIQQRASHERYTHHPYEMGTSLRSIDAPVGLGVLSESLTHPSEEDIELQEESDEFAQNYNIKREIVAHLQLGSCRSVDRWGHYLKALQLAQKIGDRELQIESYIDLANARHPDQVHYCLLAIALSEQISHPRCEARAYLALGNAQGGEIEALSSYQQALDRGIELQDIQIQVKAHLGMGALTRHSDQRFHYEEALRLATTIQDPKLLARAYLGCGHASSRGFAQRISYYALALQYAILTGDSWLQAKAHVMLGNTALREERAGHYRSAMAFARVCGDLRIQAQAHLGLGDLSRHAVEKIDHYRAAESLVTNTQRNRDLMNKLAVRLKEWRPQSQQSQDIW